MCKHQNRTVSRSQIDNVTTPFLLLKLLTWARNCPRAIVTGERSIQNDRRLDMFHLLTLYEELNGLLGIHMYNVPMERTNTVYGCIHLTLFYYIYHIIHSYRRTYWYFKTYLIRFL